MEPKATRHSGMTTDRDQRVTAVVVAREVSRPIDLCLRAALNDPWVDQVIVVDAGAPSDVASSLRALRADRRDMVLLRGQPNLSRAEASNMAAAGARGRFLLFLDPTVVLKRGAVAKLIAAGRSAPSPWIVGGRLVDAKGLDHPDAEVQAAPRGWAALAAALGFQRRRNGADDVAAVSGALMLIPRRDFDALGGFDPEGLGVRDDVDLCRRATAAGGVVIRADRAEAVQFARERREGPGSAAKKSFVGLIRRLFPGRR